MELTLHSNLPIILKLNNYTIKNKALLIFAFSSFNLIGTPLGGYLSDINYSKYKIIGRIKILLIFLILTLSIGVLFNNVKNATFNTMLIIIISWSFANNLLQGSLIGIIPHLDSEKIGVILGFISCMGTIGGIMGNLLFIHINEHEAIKYINIFGFICYVLITQILL